MSPSHAPRIMTRLRLLLAALISAGLLIPGAAAPTVAAPTVAPTTVTLTNALTGAYDGDGDALVTIPGSHNPAMGCSGEWQPECDRAALIKDPETGIYTATFDLPRGQWQYKVAIGGTWDESYGANGVPGGDNITYSLDETGPVTFFYDPATHRVWNTADGPVITLSGTLQAPLGCTRGDNGGNWAPDCLAPLMAPNGDGTWTYSTNKLPMGNYLVKVAHNRSWTENYGVDGVEDGPNYSFSVTSDKTVTFTYTMATHLLDIDVADVPLMGTGQQAAYWVDATTLAWPTSMLPKGVTADQVVSGEAGIGFSLVTAGNGGAEIIDGAVAGGESTPLTITADLPKEATDLRPNLKGYIGLRIPDGFGVDAVKRALTGQVRVLATAHSAPFAFTGVQIAPVLDALYSDDARTAELGVTWTGAGPSFALWAPTAKSVTLLSWNSRDDTGSVPQIDEDARRTPARLGPDGRWVVDNADGAITAGAQYLWEVEVYVPATGKVETNTVTDPYSIALTADSTRSVAIDLMNPAIMPEQWARTPSPRVYNDASRAIYELHVRDFSAKDESVPAALRGTYGAFTVSDSTGMRALAELAEAGIDTVHLLPTFDISTIPERRADQVTPTIPDAGPAAEDQQAAVAAVADRDAFNWGYDPFHWMTPEGSYAADGHQDGGARIAEFRDMVGALHSVGLQVVLDEVYNHTAAAGQDPKAVLDRIVPGYYHRLDATGAITTSTCCSNIATENLMSEDLMIDSLVLWARAYRVDGFRFDLMGHHSRDTMIRAKEALAELTLERDGVDGSSLYLYGEGWNFGEVANNALFTQATQGQLDGTQIGAFNDRLRDAVHGGGPFDADHRVFQGFGSGAVTDPNGLDTRGAEEQLADLMHRTDLVKLGVAGNLKDYALTTYDGSVKLGSQIDYNSLSAGYASDPAESVNYVDAHDNETLFDLLTYKLPSSTPMSDRIRMNTVSLATVALGQSPSFWAAGTERLRSKSLDRDSYNSGDHFNAIDWTGSDNGFGHGLPVASGNQEQWPIMRPLLEDPSLKPGADDIAAAKAQALDLLRLRKSTPLFSLGSARLIKEKVSFPNSGPDQAPGTFLMLIDDNAPSGASADAGNRAVTSVDPNLNGVLVVFNASKEPLTQAVDGQAGRHFVLSPVQASGSDPVVKTTTWDDATGTVTVPARTVAVLVDEANAPGPIAPLGVSYEPVAVAAGDEASATPIVRDESGKAVTLPEGTSFTLGESAPRDAVIDATTGVIRWTVPADHATTAVRIPVTVSFADGRVVTSELVVSVTGRDAASDAPASPRAGIVGALPITGAGGLLLVLAIAGAAAVAGGVFASRRRA